MSRFLQTLKQFVSPGGIEGYFAALYAECAKNSEGMREAYRELAAKAASAVQSGKILEVGPGPGYVSIEMARLLPEVGIVGLDVSERMVEVATQNAAEYGVSERIAFRREKTKSRKSRDAGNSAPVMDKLISAAWPSTLVPPKLSWTRRN